MGRAPLPTRHCERSEAIPSIIARGRAVRYNLFPHAQMLMLKKDFRCHPSRDRAALTYTTVFVKFVWLEKNTKMRVSKKLSRQTLNKSVELAEKYGLSKMKMDDITKEVKVVRRMEEARRLNKLVKKNSISIKEICDMVNDVRRKRRRK